VKKNRGKKLLVPVEKRREGQGFAGTRKVLVESWKGEREREKERLDFPRESSPSKDSPRRLLRLFHKF